MQNHWLKTAVLVAGCAVTTPSYPADTPGILTDIRPTDVIHWQAVSGETYSDGRVKLDLRLSTEQDFTIYEDKLKFEGPPGFTVSRVVGPKTRVINDPISRKDVAVYYGGEFAVEFSGLEAFKGNEFPVALTYIGCTNRICLFPHTETIMVPVFAAQNQAPVATTGLSTEPVQASISSANWESEFAKNIETGKLSFGLALAVVFVAGILTNLTPCVYPMIPITMRVLARQGHAPITSAIVYAIGIVLTYTSLGVLAASTGTMFGSIMASTAFNVVFAGLMAFLGLGMLGYGNFNWLQTVGSRLGAGKPSFKNTLLLGIGAGLVASPCTGPILAALLAYTAKSGDVRQGTVLLFIYSVGFAIPYVFLGGAAAKITQVKVSPIIQLTVKMVFAAVMVGLAFYYLRIPAYKLIKPLADHYATIASITAALGLVIGLTILAIPRLQNNKHLLLVPTLLLGMGVFSGWQYFTGAAASTGSGVKVEWIRSEGDGFAAAKAANKPMLIDAWAEWCEACKKMDATTFLEPKVVEELGSNWVVIKLDLTETTAENEAIIERLGIGSLPTLTLVPATGDLTKKHAITGYVNGDELMQHLKEFRR